MGADKLLKNIANAPKFICQIVCPSPRIGVLLKKGLHWVSVVREPNYPWFDRNSQPKPDRPRGKKWVGKNDGSHTSSKTIVACFTTADLTPALITGPVELGGAWEKGQSSAPLPHQLLVEPEVKHFPSKNLLILHSPPPILTFRRYCFIPHHVHYLL